MATNTDMDMSFEDIMFGDHENPKGTSKKSSDTEDVKGIEASEGGENCSNAPVNNYADRRSNNKQGSFSGGNSYGKRTSSVNNQGFGNGNNRRKASGNSQTPKWEIENAVLVSNFKPDFDMKAVVDLFEQECGKIKASNLKGDDKLVIQFSEAASCEKALQKSFEFEGITLQVNSSSSKSSQQQNNGTVQNGDSSAVSSPSDPNSPTQAPTDPDSLNATLVLKNLPFHVKHDKLQEILTKLVGYSPKYVRYHHDANGAFRGIAFVKYRSMEDATNAFNILNNSEVMTRKIRCEYKKKGSSKNKNPQLSTSATASTTVPATSGTNTTPTKGSNSDVNLDDSEIKEIHDRLTAFKDDPIQSELSYPATINNNQRKTVLKLCDKFGLVCIPKNDCLTVKKKSDAPNINAAGQNTASKPIGINSKRRGSNAGLGSFGGSYGANGNSGSLSTSLGRPPQSNSSSNPVSVPSSLEKTPRGSFGGRSSLGASPGTSPMFRHMRAQSLTQVIITPKGPDGTKGFAAGRGKPLAPPTQVAM